jgi:hypothetical protein
MKNIPLEERSGSEYEIYAIELRISLKARNYLIKQQ